MPNRDSTGVKEPWYVLFIAMFPVLFLYSHNLSQTPFRDVVLPLGLAVGGVTIVFLIARLISRSEWVAGAVAAALCALFFGYQSIVFVAGRVGLGVRHRWLIVAIAALLILAVWLAFHFRDRTRALALPLNAFGFILVVLTVVNLGYKSFGEMHRAGTPWLSPATTRAWTDTGAVSAASASQKARPNIYYIILDGHARADVLRDYFGYDNSAFLDFLTSRGFEVNPASHANYEHTFISLSSSLNGMLLPGASDASDWRGMIQHDAVVSFLRARGYRIVNIRSGWGPTALFPDADNIGCGAPSEFVDVLLRTTAAWPVLASPAAGGAFSPHTSRLCALHSLSDVAGAPGPRWVLGHILLPHPPFVFGAHGERLSDFHPMSADMGWNDKRAYVNQVKFVDSVISGVIDTILARDHSDPIIVLQGDHGSASTTGWNAPIVPPQLIRERMPILSAIRLPGGEKLPLDKFITPVNTFGAIFERYFGAKFNKQPDESFFRFHRVDSLLTTNPSG